MTRSGAIDTSYRFAVNPRGAGHEVIDPRGALFGEWVPSEWLWGPYTRLENPAIRTPRRCSTWNIRRNEE
jgi:hypothetical protein